MFFLHIIAPGRLFRSCSSFQWTTILALISTFFTAATAYPIDDLSGQILCLPTAHLPICEVRVTAYGYLSFSHNGASDNVLIDVYDGSCNQIGGAEAHTGRRFLSKVRMETQTLTSRAKNMSVLRQNFLGLSNSTYLPTGRIALL